jgi:hypothetical protein
MDEWLKLVSAIKDVIGVIIWPVVVLLVLSKFKDSINNLIAKSSDVTVKIPGGGQVSLKSEDVNQIVQDLLSEIDTFLKDFSGEEKELFTKILANSGNKNVEYYFKNFKRNTSEHEILRSLRGRKFIRPIEGGRWKDHKHPEVTRFGRLVAKLRKEDVGK